MRSRRPSLDAYPTPMQNHLGLIEMLAVFGIGLAFVVWELFSVMRDDKKKNPRKDQDLPGDGP
jgi:hypothetical protein